MFLFLKYLQPIWYYNLIGKTSTSVLVNPQDIIESNQINLDRSGNYLTSAARSMDEAYQALQLGVIPGKNTSVNIVQHNLVDNIKDNYIFTMRYFGRAKAVYVFFIRVLLLNNPLAELIAFAKSWSTKKVILKIIDSHLYEFEKFESKLLEKNPLVSVIIPTLNRYTYLKDVLYDLEAQTYPNFEVLICDQSDNINQEFYSGWNLNISVIIQKEKALWSARNRCIKESSGEYILLFDDDSRVDRDWIKQHLKCIDYFKVSVSAGVTNTLLGHGLSKKETYFHLSDVFDTGNAMVERSVFKKCGLFDRQFEKQRMGDGEFGLRVFLNGYQIISNPRAVRLHLKVETGGLREFGGWDAFRPVKFLGPRPIPSVLYFSRKYFGNEAAVYLIIQNIVSSFVPYRFKKSKLLKLAVLPAIPLLLPLICYAVLQSWSQSSIKLAEGPLIDTINGIGSRN